MEGGDQRCPLTAQRHIFGAKITDHVDAGFHRQAGAVADLQGEAELGSVTDGLAVRADGADLIRMMAGLGQQGAHRASKMDGDQLIHLAHAINFIGAWIAQGMQAIGHLDGPGLGVAGQQLGALAMKTNQYGINSIHAGAGHQADVEITHVDDSCKRHRSRRSPRDGGRNK